MNEKNKSYEVIVGYFFFITICTVFVLLVLFMISGHFYLFADKYHAYYKSGSGFKRGMLVTLNGVNIGKVFKVEMGADARVKVTFNVDRKHTGMIRSDSVAKVTRPLMIGAKQISLTPGSAIADKLPSGSTLLSEESSELIDIFSGIEMDSIINRFYEIGGRILSNESSPVTVREVYEQLVAALFMMKDFQVSIQSMSEAMLALNGTMSGMSSNFKSMESLSVEMRDMAQALNSMSTLSVSMSQMSGGIKSLGSNMAGLEDSMSKVSAVLDDVSSSMGEEGLEPSIAKIMGVLDELDILLKAFQRSWLIKNEVDLVKKAINDNKQVDMRKGPFMIPSSQN